MKKREGGFALNVDSRFVGARWFVPSIAPLVATSLLLSGCSTSDFQQIQKFETADMGQSYDRTGASDDDASPKDEPRESSSSTAADSEEPPLSSSAVDLARKEQEKRRAEPVLYRGTDNQVALPAAQAPIKFLGDDVSLNFEQAPLEEIVHAVMSDILNLDYVVDRPVKGNVTLRTRTPIPRDELLVVLESLLKAHDALLIRGKDGRYMVTGAQQAMRLRPQVTSAEDVVAGYSTMIVPLQYISASAMSKILQPLAEKSAFVRVDDTRNLLVLAGTRAQLTGWLEIITTFDVDMLAGMSVGFFPLEHSSVEEAVTAVRQLIRSAEGEGGDISNIVRVLPMERLNSVLVVTPRAHYLDRVGSWIERLDVEPDARFEKRLYVYPVQNTTAARLAELLNRIYASGEGGVVSRTATSAGRATAQDSNAVAPGMRRESIGGGTGSGGLGGQSGSQSGGAAGVGGTSSFGAGAANRLAGGGITGVTMTAAGFRDLSDVRVVADDENNALMIYADGRQYDLIVDALDDLDIVATQVIIEASIMEVQLTDELRYGLEWTFNNSFNNGNYNGVGQLANTESGIAALVPGFSYTVTNSTGDISAVLNALSEESLINIISTPSVMVLDNHTASISVGDQVPVLEGSSQTVGGNVVQNITYRDTGVQLSVTPSVNAGGLVTMDVQQSVIDVGNIDAATRQRTFLDRTINSRVAVRSSESVVLGGLIRENSSLGDAGVPVLHKIPFVGSLFGTTTTESRRTELLVIITPRALYNEDELRDVSEDMREQVRFMELLQKPPLTGTKSAIK